MNKKFFCILYNRAKGCWTVVRESALSRGAVRYCGCIPMLIRCVSASIVVLHPPLAVLAQVVAAPDAPPANQPMVEAAANGTPLVQIAAPNAAGLSNNHYSQFNVDGRGVILNNATGLVTTQQGGVVAGNPLLTAGSAGIILNQVVGTHPSLLTGFTEVAGQRADVIIANPNGIVCNGGGFINASRGVLTTGVPVLGAGGGLDGFRVGGGLLEIGANGLNARNIDQVDLIARSLKVNGEIHTDGVLNVITGPNRVSYSDLGVQVLPDASGKPTVGVDVGLLGGMYARKIHLIGTDAGVGVNSRGSLTATGGGFTCTQQGRIILTGQTTAGGDLALDSREAIDNSGSLYAQGKATLDSREEIRNSGTLAAQGNLVVRAAQVESSGDLGAGIDRHGHPVESGHLNVTAQGRLMATGQNAAGGGMALTGHSLSMAGARTGAGGDIALTATGGAIEHQGARLEAGGVFNAKGTGLLNQGGSISQTGLGETRIDIKGPIDNTAGSFTSSASRVHIQAYSLDNGQKGDRRGRIEHTGTGLLSIQTGRFNNDAGFIRSNGAMGISAIQDLSNVSGAIHADRFLKIRGRTVTNDGGAILSQRALSIVADTQLSNAAGRINGKGDAVIHAGSLDNSGAIEAGPYLWVQAKTVANSGLLGADGRLEARADLLDNSKGHILAPSVGLDAAQLLNGSGEVAADALRVTATDLTNTSGTMAHLGAGPMVLTVKNALANLDGGLIQSNGSELRLEPQTLDNSGGTIVHTGTGTLSLKIGDGRSALGNKGGNLFAGGAMNISAASIGNQDGTIAARQQLTATAHQGDIDNRAVSGEGGHMSGEQVRLAGQGPLQNQGGTIEGSRGVTLQVQSLDNTRGRVANTGDATLDLTAREGIVNEQGTIESRAETIVNALALDNTQGTILSSQDPAAPSGSLHLLVRDGVVNAKGKIASAHGLDLEAGTLTGDGVVSAGNDGSIRVQGDFTNSAGNRILSKGDLTLETKGTLTNAGRLESPGTVTAMAAIFRNEGSAVIEGKTAQVKATQNLINEGRITGERVALETAHGSIDNKGGRVDAKSSLALTADQLLNTGGVLTLRGTGAPEMAPLDDKQGLKINVQKMDNTSGYVRNLGDQAFTLAADMELINDRGDLYSLGPVDVTAGRVVNTQGMLLGSSVLKVKSRGELKNDGGLLEGRDQLVAEAKGALDNQGGRITVGEDARTSSTLEVTAENLDNRDGQIANLGTGDSSVTGSSRITNSNEAKEPALGLITGQGKVTVVTADLHNTQGGQLTAGTDLTLTGIRDVDNSWGTIHAQRELALEGSAATVTNTRGRLTAVGDVTLRVASINNSNGEIGTDVAGSGAVQITTASMVANAGGRIVSANDLTVTTGTMEGAGQIAGGKDTVLTLTGDGSRSSESQITAGRNLTLAAANAWKNAGGLRAPGTVTIRAGQFQNQAPGVLSGGTLQITGTQKLINEGKGRLLGENITLQSDQEIINEGEVVSQGRATLTCQGSIRNTSGTLSAQRDLELGAAEIDSKGDLSAGMDGDGKAVNPGNLRLTATRNLKVSGQSIAGGHITFTSPGMTLSGATTHAFGDISLVANGGAIEHQRGQLHARGAFQATGASLSNQNGTITGAGQGDSELKISGLIDNAAGTITSSARNLTIGSASFSNGLHGTLRHAGPGLLTLSQTGELLNDGGTLSSTGEARITAGALGNEAGLLSAMRDLTVTGTEDLRNGRGVIEAGASLELKGRTVTNSGGRMVALGGQARITDVVELNNTAGTTFQGNAGGLISGSSGATIQAGRVSNSGGTIVAAGDLSFHETKELNNSGTLSAGGALSAHAGVLNNNRGTMTAANLDLRAARLDNSGGELTARTVGGAVTDLINGNGRLTHLGTDPMVLAVTGALTNTHGGQIRSNGDLALQPSTMNNSGGIIEQAGAGTLSITVGEGRAELTNTTGTIASRGAMTVVAGAIHNNTGSLEAKGNVSVSSAGALNNTGGRIQGGAGGTGNTLQVTASTLDNSEGRIANDGTGDTTIIGTHQILNRNFSRTHDRGVIGGQGSVTISTGNLRNNGGGQLVSGGDLTIDTSRLDNVNGRVHAQRNLAMARPGGTVNNVWGEMGAAAEVRLTLSGLANLGGTVLAGQDLLLTTPTLPTNGTLVAGRDACFTLQEPFILPSGNSLSAPGNLTLTTTGMLTNSGSLEGGGCLTIRARSISNNGPGMMCGETTHVTTDGIFANNGKIYGTDIALEAKIFINGCVGTNFPGIPEVNPRVVAAQRSLQIGAESISNQGQDSLLSSEKDLAIGGHLDDKHLAVGEAKSVNNRSATIQAVNGDMLINASEINNLNPPFATRQALESEEKLNMFKASDNPVGPLGKKYLEAQLKPADWGPDGATGCWYSAVGDFDGQVRYWEGHVDTDQEGRGHFSNYTKYEVTRTITRTEVARTEPGHILAGGNLHLAAGKILNDKSRIIAGKHLQFPSGSLINTEVKGTRVIEDRGIQYYSQGTGGGRANDNPRPYHEATPYSMDVVVSVHEERTRPSLKPIPEGGSRGGSGPVGVPVVRLAGNTGTPLLGASSGSPAIQPAATGQLQAVSEAVPAIPDLRLPRHGLYSIDTSPTAPSLVVTDPKFLRGREVKGLEHMLDRLELDPQVSHKRVGDGHYESKLVSQQIVDLTGRPRLLPDAPTAHGEFVALMDNGLSHSSNLHLTAGSSLSETQQDALAQPSVWPVQQLVTLPEGKEIAVLVPKVYLTKEKAATLVPMGSALISAETMAGALTGNLENSGTLMAERSMTFTANGIENKGMVRTNGTDSSLNMHSRTDLVHAGSIQGGRVELKADRDILMTASTVEITGTNSSGTTLDRVATLTAETLVSSARRDQKLVASQIQTTGSASLTAARDMTLETVSTSYRENLDYGRNHIFTSETGVVGARLDVGGSVELKAEGDLTSMAASVTAGEDLNASAGGKVILASAEQTLSVDLQQHRSGRSTFSSWSEQTRSLRETSTSIGNLLSGENVKIQAGDSMMVQGSTVVATGNVDLDAGGNIEIKAATNTEHTSSYSHRQKSGLMSGGGLGFSIGTSTQTDVFDQREVTQSQSRSKVGSLAGHLSVRSGSKVQVQGSDLLAEGNIQVRGKDIVFEPGQDQIDHHERHEFKQTGLTVSLGGGALDQVQAIMGHGEAVSNGKAHGRALALNAMAGAAHTRALAKRAESVRSALSGEGAKGLAKASGLQVSASFGTTRSESESSQSSLTHAGSIAAAGGTLDLAATEGDLKAIGASLSGKNVILAAVRDLELKSAMDTSSSRSSNSNSSSSLGVSAGVGAGTAGISLTAAVSWGHGHSHGDGAIHLNTVVPAEENLTIITGRNAILAGAQASGRRIEAKVGGDLLITSEQDTFTYASSQQSGSVSVSVPLFGAGFSASASISHGNATADYRSVGQQSSLMAGEEGFRIEVSGHTGLIGSVIGSAASLEHNTLITRTLTTTDLANHVTAEANSSGFSAGTAALESKLEVGKTLVGGMLNQSAARQSDASTTRSAIAPGTITITDEEAQLARTGLSSAQTVSRILRNTGDTHRALERPDMTSLEAKVETERETTMLAVEVAATGIQMAKDASDRQKVKAAEPAGPGETRPPVPDPAPENLTPVAAVTNPNSDASPAGGSVTPDSAPAPMIGVEGTVLPTISTASATRPGEPLEPGSGPHDGPTRTPAVAPETITRVDGTDPTPIGTASVTRRGDTSGAGSGHPDGPTRSLSGNPEVSAEGSEPSEPASELQVGMPEVKAPRPRGRRQRSALSSTGNIRRQEGPGVGSSGTYDSRMIDSGQSEPMGGGPATMPPGRSEPEAPGNESKAEMDTQSRFTSSRPPALDMQRINLPEGEPRPEYHSPVDKGHPTIYPEDPTLVASLGPFQGVASSLSRAVQEHVTDPLERLHNKITGIGWVENRYVPEAMEAIAAKDPVRAQKLIERIELDQQIASLPLMGCGGLAPVGLATPSVTLRLPGGPPSAPAIVTGDAGVLPRAGGLTIPLPTGALTMTGPGGGTPSEPKSSQPEQPKFPDEKQLAKQLNTNVRDFHTSIKRDIKVDLRQELKQINSTNPDIGVTPDGFIVLRNPLTKQTITTTVPLSFYGKGGI